MSALAPSTSPISGVDSYAQAANAAKLAYQQAITKVGSNRQSLLRQYGYTAEIDPNTGSYSNLRVDPNNQYGDLQQMLRNQAQQDQQAEFGAEERGLHGGLANQGASDLRYAHGAESSQFGTNLIGSMSDLDQQSLGAKQSYDDTLYNAQLDAARQALAAQMFDQADFSGLDYGPYGDSTDASGDNPGTGQSLLPKPKPVGRSMVGAGNGLGGAYKPVVPVVAHTRGSRPVVAHTRSAPSSVPPDLRPKPSKKKK